MEAFPEAPTATFSFPPHRRSHLRSGTYRSLVRIWSSCYGGESKVSLATPLALQELSLRSDHASDEPARESLEEPREPGEFVGPADGSMPGDLQPPRNTDKDLGATGSKDGGSGKLQTVSDETGNALKMADEEKELMLDDLFEVFDLQDRMVGRQQMLMDELELIVNGSEELIPEDCMNLLATSFDENQIGSDLVAPADNGERLCDPGQTVVEKPNTAGELQVNRGECAQQISESVDLCLERSMANKHMTTNDNEKDNNSSSKTKGLEEGHEAQLKEVELEKSVSPQGAVLSRSYMPVEDDVEEGEISGEVQIDDESEDMLLGDAVPVEKMEGVQVSEEIINKTPLPFYDKSAISAGEKKRKGSGTEVGYQVASPGNLVPDLENVEKDAGENREISSKEKPDDEPCCKKKRKPPSENKKAKKKQKDRKKRAEKNRLLGVRRLKLRPVSKPKPVTYCRHYLKGRCHEGERCKFSHDTVPETKSMPCRHFARQSCMKGDDCPFDHELSKYPCTNFATKGFCSRGDNCLFLHKESTTSSLGARKSETAPSSVLGGSYSKEQQNISGTSDQNAAAASFSLGVLPQKSKQSVTEALLKLSVSPTKGFSSLSLGKLPVASSKPHQGSSFPWVNEHGKTEYQTSGSASNLNKTIGGIPTRNPATAPKGLNFLSFGKASSEESNSTKKASMPLDQEDGAASSQLKSYGLHDQADSSSSKENPSKAGNQATVLSTGNLNEMQKKSLSGVVPKGINILSLGRNSVGSIPSGPNNKCASSEHQTLSTKQHELPTCLPSLGQSSAQSSGGRFKTTPNSTQKTLMSALRFAADFESEKAKRLSNDSVAASSSETKNMGVVGSAKSNPSKILEFLSSLGN